MTLGADIPGGGPLYCPCCGLPLDPGRKRFDVSFELPDPVRDLTEEERARRVVGERPLIAVRNMGDFVRVLLTARLTGGYEFVFGCWIGVPADEFEQARKIWNAPEYSQLVLHGRLANEIRPWPGMLGAPLTARPRAEDELPYVEASDDPQLQRVLEEAWPHSEIWQSWSWLFAPPKTENSKAG